MSQPLGIKSLTSCGLVGTVERDEIWCIAVAVPLSWSVLLVPHCQELTSDVVCPRSKGFSPDMLVELRSQLSRQRLNVLMNDHCQRCWRSIERFNSRWLKLKREGENKNKEEQDENRLDDRSAEVRLGDPTPNHTSPLRTTHEQGHSRTPVKPLEKEESEEKQRKRDKEREREQKREGDIL